MDIDSLFAHFASLAKFDGLINRLHYRTVETDNKTYQDRHCFDRAVKVADGPGVVLTADFLRYDFAKDDEEQGDRKERQKLGFSAGSGSGAGDDEGTWIIVEPGKIRAYIQADAGNFPWVREIGSRAPRSTAAHQALEHLGVGDEILLSEDVNVNKAAND